MAIQEISAEELAARIEQGARLTKVERVAVAAIIRDFARIREAQRVAGRTSGRQRNPESPSRATIYRDRKKEGK